MKITISIDQVLRDFLSQFDYVYKKYKHNDGEDFDVNTITDFNLLSHYDFAGRYELNKFLHEEASLEIFGHADLMYDNLSHKFNKFLVEIYDEEEYDVELVSKSFYKSIPATLFFLSKINCTCNKIRFINDDENECDEETTILITANPISLDNKKENVKYIKIKAPYNSNSECELEYENIMEVFDNFEKIIK